MQWADSSIAYYSWHKPVHNRDKFCGVNLRVNSRILLHWAACSQDKPFDYLCESDADDNENEDGYHKITLHKNITGSLITNHVTCPLEHVTHAFLACDLHSGCWAKVHGALDMHDVPLKTWCPAPLAPLPPLFTCTSSLQLVPYTLVCDTRHDCDDFSDESFCVRTSCSQSEAIGCSTSAQVGDCIKEFIFI